MSDSKRIPRLEKLLKDADYILNSVDEDTEVNRKLILSTMQLYKLDIADKRTNECEDMMVELNYEEVNLDALTEVRSYIDLLDGMLAHNNYMYNKVLELALSYYME